MKCFHHRVAAIITSFFVLGFSGVVAIAGELKTSQQIMDFSTAKMATYKTWSADYIQNLNLLGNQMDINGRMVQKSPGLLWMQLDLPTMGRRGTMTVILGADGMMWQLMDMGTQVQIMKLDVNQVLSNTVNITGAKFSPLDQMDPSRQWASSREMYDFTLVNPGKFDGVPVYVMEGVWKKGAFTNEEMTASVASMVGKVRVCIGQDDGFVHSIEQYDRSLTNIVMAVGFHDLKFNMDVPDSTFVYHPPADAHVTDMTQMTEMQFRARHGATPPPATEPAPSAPSTPPAK